MFLTALLALAGMSLPARAEDPAPVLEARSASGPCNVILVGWDGAQRNHVLECLDRGVLPNLRELSRKGTIVAIDILRQTDTKAGWTQILTGYNPEVTGVFSNSRFQPIPERLSVFERLEAHFGAEGIFTAAVIGKKTHIDNDPPAYVPIREPARAGKAAPKKNARPGPEIVVRDGVRCRVQPGKPYFQASKGMDLFENGLQKDAVVGARALEVIESHKGERFFLFVHFAEVDQSGHRFGENSKAYDDALVSADTWTGKIMEKLEALGLADRTLLYVTADHGFDEGRKQHADAPYVFLATNDPEVRRRGERADIAPTILERFGVDLDMLAPPLDGHPLTRDFRPPMWREAAGPRDL